MKTSYHLNVQRGKKYWVILIPELEGATQARNLSEIEDMARDYIATMLDINPDSFDVITTIHLPEETSAHLDAATQARKEEAQARTLAATESRAAARSLRAAGLTVRDIGQLLGVSFQRAQQLLAPQQSPALPPTQ